MPKPVTAFTLRNGKGRIPILATPVEVSLPGINSKKKYNGIWDTGATGTVITQKIVDDLKIQPIGIAFVSTASEQNVQTYRYVVDVHINGSVCVQNVIVTLGVISKDFDCLIGMDIITLGDFSVTNFQGITTFSFRMPSIKEIDYVKELKEQKNIPEVHEHKAQRNDPCPCGSGKKYKHCHGKNN